nr:hypothetical protein [Streptomyces sp. SID5785]
MIALQRAADDAGRRIEHLDDSERPAQRESWFRAAAAVQAAVTAYADAHGLDHFEVEKQLRQTVRHLPRREEWSG